MHFLNSFPVLFVERIERNKTGDLSGFITLIPF